MLEDCCHSVCINLLVAVTMKWKAAPTACTQTLVGLLDIELDLKIGMKDRCHLAPVNLLITVIMKWKAAPLPAHKLRWV